jgi:hypothetical protein
MSFEILQKLLKLKIVKKHYKFYISKFKGRVHSTIHFHSMKEHSYVIYFYFLVKTMYLELFLSIKNLDRP